MDSRQKDIMIDSILYSSIFYILSTPEVFALTKSRCTNTFLFGFCFILIQKITNRV